MVHRSTAMILFCSLSATIFCGTFLVSSFAAPAPGFLPVGQSGSVPTSLSDSGLEQILADIGNSSGESESRKKLKKSGSEEPETFGVPQQELDGPPQGVEEGPQSVGTDGSAAAAPADFNKPPFANGGDSVAFDGGAGPAAAADSDGSGETPIALLPSVAPKITVSDDLTQAFFPDGSEVPLEPHSLESLPILTWWENGATGEGSDGDDDSDASSYSIALVKQDATIQIVTLTPEEFESFKKGEFMQIQGDDSAVSSSSSSGEGGEEGDEAVSAQSFKYGGFGLGASAGAYAGVYGGAYGGAYAGTYASAGAGAYGGMGGRMGGYGRYPYYGGAAGGGSYNYDYYRYGGGGGSYNYNRYGPYGPYY